MIKKGELDLPVFMGNSSLSQGVHGISFPADPNVTQAISDFIAGKINYIQLSIDAEKERICLAQKDNPSEWSVVADKIPKDEPRFHFYNYQHEFDGNNVNSFLFIFSCPDGSSGTSSAPVKLRMLYSSSKGRVSELLTSANATIAVKLEINSAADLVEDDVFRQLHPQAAEKSTAFSKPSRPGKGARKLIRGNNPQQS